MTPFTKRLKAAGMTAELLAFLTNISEGRIKAHARGEGTLTTAELDRIDKAIAHKPVVYGIWKRKVADAEAVTILHRHDGVLKVRHEPQAV